MIRFSVADFAAAAKALRSIPNSAIRVDIYEHARLHAAANQMVLTMSDMEMEAHITMPCVCEGEILAAIPMAVLEFFIARSTGGAEGTLEFDAAMRNVTARIGKARMTIAILRGEDFVSFEKIDPAWSIGLRAHELCGALRKCEDAIAEDGTRFYLEGVFMTPRNGELLAVATNGHHLHLTALDLPDEAQIEGWHGMIIPENAVGKILKLFADDESAVLVSGSKGFISIAAERIRLIAKLIDHDYVDFQRVIPEAGDFSIVVDGKALEQCAATLTLIPKVDGKGRRETARAVRITPAAEDNEILVEMRGTLGEAQDRLPAEIVGSGEPITIDVRYLRQMIAAAGDGKVRLAPCRGDAARIRCFGPREADTFIIMQRHF
ncbi:DNA polymerase III subunit beta [Tianweitania sediminis]|uniref:Beta sliding clamp n=1 Tax=Tianweitania sediminis TaxID=1502156 RepID=A0A8J7UJ96_9HYPH|nr:DNA polymerase III subunit beta [Tianweitania sediminis]MBP0438449.1 hypothetical protein [Tianweitania sediminis]